MGFSGYRRIIFNLIVGEIFMSVRYKLSFILLGFFFLGILNAQNVRVDSLVNLLNNRESDDTVKVNLLNELAYAIVYSDQNKSKEYAVQANIIAQNTGYRKGEAESLCLIGISLMKTDNTLALETIRKALEINQQINYLPGTARCYNNMGIIYKSLGDPEKEILYYQKALKIAEAQNDQPGISKYLINISLYHNRMGNFNQAIEGFEKSLIILKKLNDIPNISKCYNNLGSIFANQGNYPLALEYFQNSLKIGEDQNDQTDIINGYINISGIKLSQNNNTEALINLRKALKIAEEINDNPKIAGCLLNIGNVYQKTDQIQALEYFQKALSISEKHNLVTIRLQSLISVATSYMIQDKMALACETLHKALKIAESINHKHSICIIWMGMGKISFKQKNYSKAIYFSQKSLALANELQLLNEQRDINELLSDIYSATGNYKNAYMYHKLFKHLNDSLNNRDNIRKIAEIELTYKYEKEKQLIAMEQQKKDAIQASEKRQQRIIIFTLAAGLILLLFFFVYAIKSYQVKHELNILLTKQKQEIEEKNRKLQELNSTKDKFFSIIAHDLRGSFNTILGFSDLLISDNEEYNQKRIMNYANLVNSSAKSSFNLLENLLEWAMSNRKIMTYKPQSFDLKKFVTDNENIWQSTAMKKNISIKNALSDNCMVYADPNMLNTIMRNLITNAIKFTHKGGKITISSLQREKEMEITISDTGIGMSEEVKRNLFKIDNKKSSLGTEKEGGTGLGLILCKDFVEKHNGKIWCSSELGKGSDFKFTIPLK